MRENEPKMDTGITAQTVKPSGDTIPNGTPGKVQGYSATNQPFENVGNDSGDEGAVLFPTDQMSGFKPGSGRTQNNPDA